MKKHIFSVIFAASLTFSNVNAQTSVVSVGNTRGLNPNTFGYNNNEDFSPSWLLKSSQEAIANTYAHYLRYPGGTSGNYFNWETGEGYKPVDKMSFNLGSNDTYGNTSGPECADKPNLYCTGSNVSGNNIYDYIKGLDEINKIYASRNLPKIKPIYMMNVGTSEKYAKGDLPHQLRALRTLKAEGYEPEYIQMGNEIFIDRAFPDYTDMFPTAEAYADTVKRWILVIKKEFPNIKWSIPAVKNIQPYVQNPSPTGERNTTWTRRILGRLAQSPNPLIPNSVTFHYYTIGANNTNSADVFGQLYNAYSTQNWYNFFPLPDNNHLNGPGEDNIKLWVTEWGMAGQSTNPSGDQWFYALQLCGMGLMQLESPRLEISTCHVAFAGSSWSNLQMTAPHPKQNLGWGTYMLNKATFGKTEARKLSFSNNPALSSTSTYPSLYGWEFSKTGGAEKEQIVINFSESNRVISTSGLPSRYELLSRAPYDIISYTSDDQFVAAGGQKFGNVSGSTITLPPTSIIRFFNDQPAVTQISSELEKNTFIIPNPTNGQIKIISPFEIEKIEVLNIVGEVIYSGSNKELDLSNQSNGIYFVRVFSFDNSFVQKKVFLSK